MSASEKNEKKAKPVIKDSPTDINTSPSGNACICKDGRDIMCQIHGG
jgi:hypothetical protein